LEVGRLTNLPTTKAISPAMNSTCGFRCKGYLGLD
jgi:hypothetical protein